MASSTTSIRRRIRKTSPTTAKIHSTSGQGIHQISIDPETGAVRCSCLGFQYKKGHDSATVATPDLFCRHLRQYVLFLNRSLLGRR